MSENLKKLAASVGAQHTQNGYKCLLLKPRGGKIRVNIQHKPTNVSKTIAFTPKVSPKGTKLFDWDPIIDGLALAGDAIAPELMPFIHMGKGALKSWLKGKKEHKGHEKREKKHHHESKLEEAMEGVTDERRLTPFQSVQKGPLPMVWQPRKGALAQYAKTFDNQVITRKQADEYAAKRGNFSGRPKFDPKDIVIQDNLRQCVKQSRLVKTDKIENYAPMKKQSHISEHSVPVLNGDMGTSMDMHPVTISKSEAHAIMAGSELLTDLSIVAGGGTPGNNILDFYINPTVWEGTKVSVEAKTWQQYRFRKFILEYCPTIGSGTTGNFIAWFTNDPDEQMSNGLAQRRNAMVHDHAVNFQPFSYMCCALTEKPQDKSLYYVDIDAGVEDRLSYQGRVLITNNAQNADTTTVPAYGTITIHYEIDFYFPRIDPSVTSGSPQAGNMTGDATPTAGLPIKMTYAGITGNTLGSIYTFQFTSLPANSGGQRFTIGGITQDSVQVGQTYLLRCFNITGSTQYYVFNSMRYANGDTGDTDGALSYTFGPFPGASATWGMANINKVNPFLLEDYKKHHHDDDSSSDEHSDVNDTPLPVELTQSEFDLVDLRRKVKHITIGEGPDPLPEKQLPTIRARHAIAHQSKQ